MSEGTTTAAAPLTVVLVHGAFADASSWNGVIERLQASGVQATAPANPLRGISIDSAYAELRAFFSSRTLDGHVADHIKPYGRHSS